MFKLAIIYETGGTWNDTLGDVSFDAAKRALRDQVSRARLAGVKVIIAVIINTDTKTNHVFDIDTSGHLFRR